MDVNEQFIMRPGDTFIAEECGCSFTVESGPNDENMASQAPRCCCGHQMFKQGASMGFTRERETGMTDNQVAGDMPAAMPG